MKRCKKDEDKVEVQQPTRSPLGSSDDPTFLGPDQIPFRGSLNFNPTTAAKPKPKPTSTSTMEFLRYVFPFHPLNSPTISLTKAIQKLQKPLATNPDRRRRRVHRLGRNWRLRLGQR